MNKGTGDGDREAPYPHVLLGFQRGFILSSYGSK